MDTKEKAASLYQKIKLSLNERLTQQGYAPVHEEPADAVYGNCYMLWSDDVEAIRFAWNGKERWFCLEITEDLPIRPLTHWEEILIKPYVSSKEKGVAEYVSVFLESLK